jgi:hypothetical protein
MEDTKTITGSKPSSFFAAHQTTKQMQEILESSKYRISSIHYQAYMSQPLADLSLIPFLRSKMIYDHLNRKYRSIP